MDARQRLRCPQVRARPGFFSLVSLLVVVVGCVHGGRVRVSPEAPPGSTPVVAERALFRVRFQGQRESGSMRLALHRAAADRFQLRASDTFGRSLWSLSVAGGVSRIIDHRSRRYCQSMEEVHVPAIALAPLPVDGLPDMLSGRLPVVPAAGENPETGEFRDTKGRRWTLDSPGGVLDSWTLWDGEEPSLWWRRQERGGVLSHRGGYQVRWRSTVVEPMTEPLEELESPPDFRRVDCSLLAEIGSDQDQR